MEWPAAFDRRTSMVDSQERRRPVRGWLWLAAVTVAWCSWLYVAVMLGLWLLIRSQADRWWPATLVIFGPRWIWALPLAGLVPAAIGLRRRSLIPLGIGSLLLVVPVMDFCLPRGQWLARDPAALRLRILTCNVDNVALNAHALRGVMDYAQPDLVACQEWTDRHRDVLFSQPGWHVRIGTGLCLGSRYPIQEAEAVPDEHGWRDVGMRCDLTTPTGRTLHFFNVHLSTPREGLEAVLAGRWKGIPELQANMALRARESAELSRWISRSEGDVVIAGDFNMPSESLIYRQAWGRFTDAFAAAGLGLGHTKSTRLYGIRIDHILAGPGWHCRRCWVGPDVGSDHFPVLADLEWIDSPP
jgi:endonuclease/exonuclease/phosphatase (EEP) superfamily protein YafD